MEGREGGCKLVFDTNEIQAESRCVLDLHSTTSGNTAIDESLYCTCL